VVKAEVVVDAVATPQALSELGPEALVERRPDGSGRFAVEVSNPEAFVNWALGLLDRAEVVSPPSLRQAVRARLEAVAESDSSAAAGAAAEVGA
jgi:predicted DNA-binding transcriptional regulator YafY